MMIALWSLSFLFTAWLLHLVIWRIRLPANHTHALLTIFFVSPFVFIATCTYFGGGAPNTRLEWLLIASVYVPCALCYIIAYSAIEHESPTCRVMRMIADAGEKGIGRDEILAVLKPENFVQERLASLTSTGGLCFENGTYRLLPKGRRMALFFTLVARIFGIRTKGG